MGCRSRAPVTDLVRVVARGGQLTPDPRRRMPGRGASLHPSLECLHAAERRRAFVRALRSSAPLETGLLRAHLGGESTDPLPSVPGGRDEHQQRRSAPPQSDRHPAGPRVESRTSSDEPPVKSQR
ncbi:YlxR family protein [Goekera deserti]|uniref:YlxR family protein n=1 Tax=Goekera deserti TaxID=2497753 RepID=UPI0022A67685|nr:YlxR family protein [Goekera deserti]